MNLYKRKNKIITNIVSSLVILAALGINLYFCFKDVISAFSFSNMNLGMPVDLPTRYMLSSTVFTLMLFVYIIFGYKLKNYLLMSIPLIFELLMIVGFVMLSVLVSNEEVSEMPIYLAFGMLSPFYGFLWLGGILALIVIVALIITNLFLIIRASIKSKIK